MLIEIIALVDIVVKVVFAVVHVVRLVAKIACIDEAPCMEEVSQFVILGPRIVVLSSN